MRKWAILGAVNGLLAVLMGAFATHGLKPHVSAYELSIFEMVAHYQMYLALAFFVVAWFCNQTQSNPRVRHYAEMAGWAFFTGIILFCGSLYMMGATGTRSLVIATPIGGFALILGWILLIIGGCHLKGEQTK